MQLKKIILQGFKSFPDRTEINIEKGITGIVGPNGSGKSNISDAILWVLGEQSAKTLRGSKMEDVIFAGTQERQPVSFAEVSLVFENNDRTLPSDSDEVAVTRKVFRNGEGGYFINKSSCRLKDIHEMFMDTGIGKGGYSIIGQGKIDNILSTKSEERRQIFEEASGIAKFRNKKDEASRKLKQTEENIVRIEDIFTELELQIEPLFNKQKKAKKYLVLKDELKELEVSFYVNEIDKLKKSNCEITDIYKEVQSKINRAKDEINQNEETTRKLYAQINHTDMEAEKQKSIISEYEADKNQFERNIDVFKNSIENNKQNIERYKEQILNLNSKLSDSEKVLSEFVVKEDTLYKMRNELEGKLKELVSSFQAIDKSVNENGKIIEDAKSEIIEKINEVSELKFKIGTSATMKDNYISRLDAVKKDIVLKTNQKEEFEGNKKEVENKLSIVMEKLKEINIALSNVALKINDNICKAEDTKKDIAANKNTYNSTLSRINILNELENNMEGMGRGVKGILNASKQGVLKKTVLYGTISSLIKVNSKYAVAAETALGSGMQNVVCDNEQDAKQAIEYLKHNKLGRCVFLPLASVKGTTINSKEFENEKGFIGIASNLISFETKFSGVIGSLLGRVLVFDNIDNAVLYAKKTGYKYKLVTLEGELLNPGGSISGGSTNKNTGILSRKAEIDSLSDKSRKTMLEIEKLENELNKINTSKTELIHQQETLLVNKNELDSEKIKLSSDLSHYDVLVSSVSDNIAALTHECNEINKKLEEISDNSNENTKLIDNLNKQVEQAENKVRSMQAGYLDVVAKRDSMNSEILSQRFIINSLEKDIEHNLVQKNQCESNVLETKNLISSYEEEISKATDDISCMEQDIEFKQEQIDGLDDEIVRINQLIDELVCSKGKNSETIIQNQEKAKVLMDSLFSLQEEFSQIEGNKNKSELELENIYNKLWEEYELTYSTAQDIKIEIEDFDKCKKRITTLKNSIKNLGNVNIDSIEEYIAVKERYDFIKEQKDDLISSRDSLNKVIDDMTSVMRKVFSENFKKINSKFSEIFRELFGGGRAELILTDPSNVLESPIEIEVQPPGKKLQNISLLSGGEKAFTAISILFAIIHVKPAPFCTLDEIEAALDELNVYKFANYLKNYIHRTQFIVITHRRGTMELANVLYGITMQEKGVSKILPLSLDDLESQN